MKEQILSIKLLEQLAQAKFQEPELSQREGCFVNRPSGDRQMPVYHPSLGELIRACMKSSNPSFSFSDTRSVAAVSAHSFTGKTPEEAVARLWLHLNT